MEEDIEILEEFIKYYEAEATTRKFRGTLSISVDEDDINALANLINKYKELKENSIPISLIEEKIEELDNMIYKINNGNLQRYTVGEILCFRKVLQELLKERKK